MNKRCSFSFRLTFKVKVMRSFLLSFQSCELIPFENCVLKTKLVPKLKAIPVCTRVPRQFCHINYVRGEKIRREMLSVWCRLVNETTPSSGMNTDLDMPTMMENEMEMDETTEMPDYAG